MWGEMRGRGCVVSGRVRDSIFALVFSMEGGGKINFFGSDLLLLVALDTLGRVVGEEGRVVGEEGEGCGGKGGLWEKRERNTALTRHYHTQIHASIIVTYFGSEPPPAEA